LSHPNQPNPAGQKQVEAMNKANIIKKRNLFGNDNMGKEGVVNEVGAMDMKFAGNVSDIQISLSIIHLFYLSN